MRVQQKNRQNPTRKASWRGGTRTANSQRAPPIGRTTKNVLVLVLAITLAIVLAEGILRIWHATSDTPIGANEEERCLDKLLTHLSDESNPKRFMPSDTAYFEYSNITGLIPKAEYWSEAVVRPKQFTRPVVLFTTRTNSLRTRDTHELNDANQESVRIAALGDSFTWGAETYLRFSYPAIMERLIPDSEVLNFGVEGTGIDTMYLRWKYEAVPLRPNITILGVFYDDIRRTQACENKPRLVVEDGIIIEKNTPPPKLFDISQYPRPVRSVFWKDLQYVIRYRGKLESIQYAHGLELFDAMLDEMRNKSANMNTTLIILFIDEGHGDAKPSSAAQQAMLRARGIATEKNITWISSTDIFREEGYEFIEPEKPRTHFTATENAYIAQGIASTISLTHTTTENKYLFYEQPVRGVPILIGRQNDEGTLTIIPYDYAVTWEVDVSDVELDEEKFQFDT